MDTTHNTLFFIWCNQLSFATYFDARAWWAFSYNQCGLFSTLSSPFDSDSCLFLSTQSQYWNAKLCAPSRGSAIWPICNLLALHSNKKVDVGIFTIINNLSPVFTMLVAIPFLHESMTSIQFVGAGLLIASGILATIPQMRGSNKISTEGIVACLLTALALGLGVAYERFMLSRVDFGTYLIFGWGSQIVWAVVLARNEIKKLPELFKMGSRIKQILLVWGAATLLKSVSFILSLKTSSASITSVATDFLSVVVVVSAYFFLKERNHIGYKILAIIIGVAGLIFLAK